jgi:hypothetical protein
MLEKVRESLRSLLAAAQTPADRRAVLADMKETLVRARLGVDDVRAGLAESRRRLQTEERELATVRRRRDLAAKIGDAETVAVAERFERQHAEHAEVLTQKVAVQERELWVLEREVAELGEEFRRALAGLDPTARGPLGEGGAARAGAPPAGGAGGPEGDPLAERSPLEGEIDQLARDRTRAARDADADARLDALKRRMGR